MESIVDYLDRSNLITQALKNTELSLAGGRDTKKKKRKIEQIQSVRQT